MNYNAWTPATDTTEIRMDLRGPFFEKDTLVLSLLDLHPGTPPRLPKRLRRRAAARIVVAGLCSVILFAAVVVIGFLQDLTPLTAIH